MKQFEIYLVDKRGETVCQFVLEVDNEGEIQIEPIKGFFKGVIEEKFC